MRAAPAPVRKALLSAARRAPGAAALASRGSGEPQWAETTLPDGVRLRLDLTQGAQNTMFYGLYEPEERELIQRLLKPGRVFVDVGAHVGYMTLAGARVVGPTGAVHAFEPSPDNASRLRANVRLNAYEHVVVNELAVSDRSGTITLYLPTRATREKTDAPETSVLGSIVPGAIPENVRGVEVATTTLDAYCEERGVASVDLVKLDAEGAELAVIRGLAGLMASAHPPSLIVEVSAQRLKRIGESPDAIHAALTPLGYRAYQVTTAGLIERHAPSGDDTTSENFLFLARGASIP